MWKLIPRDKSGQTITLSHEQAEFISNQWKNNTVAELRNSEGNLIEVLHRKDWQLKRGEDDLKKDVKKWICDYGVHHPMSVWPAEKCGCKEKYGSKWELLEWCQTIKKIDFPYQITDNMRYEYLTLKNANL